MCLAWPALCRRIEKTLRRLGQNIVATAAHLCFLSSYNSKMSLIIFKHILNEKKKWQNAEMHKPKKRSN